MRFIFLDFDGVLHSHYGAVESALWFFLPRFESVLRDYPHVKIVVSSSWGDGRSLDELRAFFSADIAPRVVGKVRAQLRRMRPNGERGDACARYCRRHHLRAGDWVAIDDTPSLFRRTHPLIYCANGFREGQELQLRMVLAQEIPAWGLALQTVAYLFGAEFNGDALRTREYVLTHRTEYGDGRTFAELFFLRRRRAIEKEVHLMDAMRPTSPRRTEQEMVRLFGYAPEQLRALRG